MVSNRLLALFFLNISILMWINKYYWAKSNKKKIKKIGKSKGNVLAGVRKTFEWCQHTEMHFPALKAQDEGKIELPPDRGI